LRWNAKCLALNFIFHNQIKIRFKIRCSFSALNIHVNTNIFNVYAISFFVQDNYIYLHYDSFLTIINAFKSIIKSIIRLVLQLQSASTQFLQNSTEQNDVHDFSVWAAVVDVITEVMSLLD